MKHLLDTSNYPTGHPLYSTTNKAVPGLMKDETKGRPIREFIGLRAKLYSVLMAGGGTKQAAAGTKGHVARKHFTHDKYRDVLFGQTDGLGRRRFDGVMVGQTSIRSYNHALYTIKQNRLGLSCIDDKRVVLDDLVSTRSHGHVLNK